MKEINKELKATAQTVVDNTNTAKSVKSGSLDVFATPMMLALMEEATCKAVDPILDDNETTVGTKVSVSHDKASGINSVITAHATLINIDGRRLTFEVWAEDGTGDSIGKGQIERFVVIEEKFMRRIGV